jgi:hypothetical protein
MQVRDVDQIDGSRRRYLELLNIELRRPSCEAA